MGKFYFENKHKWFQHQAKRSHQKKMKEGGSLAVAIDLVDELRFFLKEDSGVSPKYVRVSEHQLERLSVVNANSFVGELDDASSVAMREFFKKNPDLAGLCPAVVIRREEWSGAYVLKLGTDE